MRTFIFIAATIASGFFLATPAMAATLSGTPATTATVGKLYTFTPTLSGSSSCSNCFRVRSLPSWASFSAKTGTLSGTPKAAGVFRNIRIYALARRRIYSLPAFTITVSAATATPTPTSTPVTISGTPPATATVGQFYSFTPTVRAGSTASLSFATANKPAWTTFNTANGTLSGTPAAGNATTYSNIVISVSDGKTSATLAPFSITVSPADTSAGTGTVTLTWTAPTQNTNGSSLTNLAGYYIYYGTSATSLSSKLSVAAPATSASIEDLSAGTWYFALSDYTTAGTESARTSTVSKVVN